MKVLSGFLIVMTAIFFSHQEGSADRLYHWVDAKGVTHLSQEPPPQDGKLLETMEYSVSKDKPVKADQVESVKMPQKQNGNGIDEKLQETKEQQKPKDDLAAACYITGDLQAVYVYVTEFTDPDQVLERVLYQGTIPKSQKQLIESSSGKIDFSYRRSSDDRTYGDNHADCVNGHVISIP